MPGGSGLLEQMLSRKKELVATARELLAGCPQDCETACYTCLKTFRNQFYHPMLDRLKAHELMDELDHEPQHCRDIVPLFEEEQPGERTPSNKPEARLVAAKAVSGSMREAQAAGNISWIEEESERVTIV